MQRKIGRHHLVVQYMSTLDFHGESKALVTGLLPLSATRWAQHAVSIRVLQCAPPPSWQGRRTSRHRSEHKFSDKRRVLVVNLHDYMHVELLHLLKGQVSTMMQIMVQPLVTVTVASLAFLQLLKNCFRKEANQSFAKQIYFHALGSVCLCELYQTL